MQQRAGAKREAEQQPLDGVVAAAGAGAHSDGVPGRARGALDERNGERDRDGEEQAAQALVAGPDAGGAFGEGTERDLGSKGAPGRKRGRAVA